ncbi:SMI1/KNR4 family protein [Lignipirellula cremea]|uniref:Knr4/Smi1-like domain-containing protein n=1 Tax=Lignipirellula cremea TaxID=2528010 RepID=A0A518DQJ6_9BACT|nr:SMI1/KNR4 family protein [Lignipirellula cremea]QDU94092.1 hypothetical protein Pla8534_18780 [Lignipirellula cremea]
MSKVDWEAIFQDITKESPATNDDIAFLQEAALAPLTEDEIVEINATQNPYPASNPLYNEYEPFDPTGWVIPQRKFPDSFVDCLRWSNGGNFVNGEREFGMFGPEEIRQYLLSYQLPEYMPGAVPFALDGGGGFFLFDMRNEVAVQSVRMDERPARLIAGRVGSLVRRPRLR